MNQRLSAQVLASKHHHQHKQASGTKKLECKMQQTCNICLYEIMWADLNPNVHQRHTAYADYATDVRFWFLADHGFTPHQVSTVGTLTSPSSSLQLDYRLWLSK